jgi:hypothetical protein
VIVDNSASNFVNMLENGIPIINFVSNKDDLQLLKLGRYLKKLRWCGEDFRVFNGQWFGLGGFKDANNISHACDMMLG